MKFRFGRFGVWSDRWFSREDSFDSVECFDGAIQDEIPKEALDNRKEVLVRIVGD
jgi:hypothetical protein